MSRDFNTNTANADEWLTPPSILRALGTFDLDPCAPVNRPWDMASHHYSVADDGLSKPVYPKEFGDVPLDKKQGKPRLHQICVAMAMLLAEAERLAAGIDRYAEQMPKIRPEFQDELVAKLDALVRSANKE